MERPEEDDDVIRDRHQAKFLKKRKEDEELDKDEKIFKKKKPIKGKSGDDEDDWLEDGE